MIVECREICDACYNCVHRGGCRWDHARQCMIREEPDRMTSLKLLHERGLIA